MLKDDQAALTVRRLSWGMKGIGQLVVGRSSDGDLVWQENVQNTGKRGFAMRVGDCKMHRK
jgi:hypothetical protein